MKSVVLAEKPSVGRDIARVLNCKQKGNGYLEGDKYIVTWALGHLVTLATPEQYDKKYKTWNIDDLPIIPEKMKLVVIKETGGQYKAVREQLCRKDVNQIIIATDAGREGELVARWIIEMSGVRKPIKRLWISSVTDKAIKEGFSSLKDGKLYEGLYNSAVSRSEADWIVGMNASRALTCKYNAQLSCGRVQTPTLAIIAHREQEIRNFVPKPYYGITASAASGQGSLKLTWQDSKTNSTRCFDKQQADSIFESVKGKNGTIVEVNKAMKKKYAPKLYDLTELQRDANKLYNFSAKDTLSYMQSLYERHKVLTYPRTDSRYISTDIVPTLKDRVRACGVGSFSKFCHKILQKPIIGNNTFVDNAKVSDHHAIIPTEQTVILSDFSASERKIYELVVKRFLAVLMPPFEYEQTTIKAKIGNETFYAKGKIVKSLGFKEIYGSNAIAEDDDENDDDISEQNLPNVKKGEQLKITNLTQTQGKTKPPSPFNEATLLSAMENPAAYMKTSDKALIKTIGETGGLGTVATRADIIEKLFNSFCIEKSGKNINITSKGKQLLELVPKELKSPELTAKWEQTLGAIAKNNVDKKQFLGEMKNYTINIVSTIAKSSEIYKHDNITMERCPECGKFMLDVNGKNGKMLVCQNRDCGHRKVVATISNARCPNCHKKLTIKGKGETQTFVCPCGFSEKMSAFKKRREAEGDKASKKDVSKIINQINKENDKAGFNNAFAKAFKDLGLK